PTLEHPPVLGAVLPGRRDAAQPARLKLPAKAPKVALAGFEARQLSHEVRGSTLNRERRAPRTCVVPSVLCLVGLSQWVLAEKDRRAAVVARAEPPAGDTNACDDDADDNQPHNKSHQRAIR